MPNAPLVLVVEDDNDLRAALTELLYEEGYNTHGVRNGREALDYLQSDQRLPSLILLDLLMPEVTGWEVISSLKHDDKMSRIPVCAISGAAVLHPEHGVRFLRKPLDLDTILNIVQHHCGTMQ